MMLQHDPEMKSQIVEWKYHYHQDQKDMHVTSPSEDIAVFLSQGTW
jgi:hypothetical protein